MDRSLGPPAVRAGRHDAGAARDGGEGGDGEGGEDGEDGEDAQHIRALHIPFESLFWPGWYKFRRRSSVYMCL